MKRRVTFYDIPPQQRWTKIHGFVEAALRRKKPLLIHCADPATARELDEWLWTSRDDSFLPHEFVAPGKALSDEEATVVIVAAEMNPHQASVLVQEGPVRPEFAHTFEAVIDFVDHRSAEALQASRQRYKTWRNEEGIALDYRKG